MSARGGRGHHAEESRPPRADDSRTARRPEQIPRVPPDVEAGARPYRWATVAPAREWRVTVPVPNSPRLAAEPAATDPQAFSESLLYSVSHDLRSPLLTMSLSTDLIEDALRASGTETGDTSVSVALDALRHGARDMERMLQGLALLSRAYNGAVEPARAPLRLVLAGHLVISDASDLNETLITVDPIVVRELLDVVASDGAAELHVRIEEGFALVEVAAPRQVEGGVTPLMALVSSLTYGAGTAVETLAVRQVLIERHGGRVCAEGGRLEIWLPLADSAGPAGDAS